MEGLGNRGPKGIRFELPAPFFKSEPGELEPQGPRATLQSPAQAAAPAAHQGHWFSRHGEARGTWEYDVAYAPQTQTDLTRKGV